MEADFNRVRLESRHGLAVLVTETADRHRVHDVIYSGLVQGRIEPSSRSA